MPHEAVYALISYLSCNTQNMAAKTGPASPGSPVAHQGLRFHRHTTGRWGNMEPFVAIGAGACAIQHFGSWMKGAGG